MEAGTTTETNTMSQTRATRRHATASQHGDMTVPENQGCWGTGARLGRGRARAIIIRLIALVGVMVASSHDRAQAEPLLVYEPTTQAVLYGVDIDQKWHPASLTKIMTAYLVFQALRDKRITPDTKVVASEAASKMPPSKIGLPVGTEISLELAVKALIIKSANDVAVMLAETVSGSEQAFVAQMNQTAQQLGMSRTFFVNPNGLPADAQVTTARDMALLTAHMRRTFPEYNHLWAIPSFQFGKHVLRSHNSLLKSYDGANGMKTGFICDSGFNIVVSAERNGRQLIAVVLGAKTSRVRTIRATSLLEHGFQTYGWKIYFNTPKLNKMPLGTTTPNAPTIRNTLPLASCNALLAQELRRKRQARLRRLRKAKAARAKRKNRERVRSAKRK